MVATSLIRCGSKFGQLATIRGVTKYQISPFEQKVFGGFFVKSTVNVLWLLRRNIFYFGPRMSKDFFYVINQVIDIIIDFLSALVISYYTYTWVEGEHDRLQRKQPGEFDHET